MKTFEPLTYETTAGVASLASYGEGLVRSVLVIAAAIAARVVSLVVSSPPPSPAAAFTEVAITFR